MSKKTYLFETKTKSDIREGQLLRQLKFDLQTLFYIVAMEQQGGWPAPVGGVHYNVVRRPLSGGKGTIVRHKPSKSNPQGESQADFYGRVAAYIDEAPETYFMRWDVEVTPQDVTKFRREFLDPILEQLCDWYEWVSACQQVGRSPFETNCANGRRGIIGDANGGHLLSGGIHYRHPYGTWNALDEGGATDLDDYLDNGNTVGLVQVDRLFEELT